MENAFKFALFLIAWIWISEKFQVYVPVILHWLNLHWEAIRTGTDAATVAQEMEIRLEAQRFIDLFFSGPSLDARRREELIIGQMSNVRFQRFMDTIQGPSYPPDPPEFRISREGLPSFRWDRNLDDFWNDVEHNLLKEEPEDFTEEQDGIEDITKCDWFEEHSKEILQEVKDYNWIKETVQLGHCYYQLDGTLCQVHRWNTYDTEAPDKIVGRLQCWDDARLERLHKGTPLEMKGPLLPMGDGTVCLVELEKSGILEVGCPVSHAEVMTNKFSYVSSHGEADWEFDVLEETTALETVEQMIDFVFTDTPCNRYWREEEERAAAHQRQQEEEQAVEETMHNEL